MKKPYIKPEIKVFAISPLQEKQVFVKDAQDSIFAANKVLLTDRTLCFSQNILLEGHTCSNP